MRLFQLLSIGYLILLMFSCNNKSNDEIDLNDTINSFNPLPNNLLRRYRDSFLETEYYSYEDWLITKYFYRTDGSILDSISYHYDNNKLLDYTIEFNGSFNRTDTNNFRYNKLDNLIFMENKAYGLEFNLAYNSYNQIEVVEWVDEYGSCCMETYQYDEKGNIIVASFSYPEGLDIDSIKYDNNTNPLKNFWMSNVDPDPEYISQNNVLQIKSYIKTYHVVAEQPITVTTSENEWNYAYEYNENGLPINVIKYNLDTHDTTIFQYEYIVE